MSSSPLRILVLGYLVRGPMGGMAWHHLQYLMGLRALGHDAWFLEDSGDSDYCCYDPARNINDRDPSYGLRFAANCFERAGVGGFWGYHDAHTRRWHGPASARIREILAGADILINLSCSHVVRPWFDQVPVRVLVDTDPLFTQVRHLTTPSRRALAERHNRFLTFAGNFGEDDCGIPDDGFPWKPTCQPVVLEAWPVTPWGGHGGLSTVMQWHSYESLEFQGRRYGMKSEMFGGYLDLPNRCQARFDLAVGGGSAPRDDLRQRGWRLHDPNEIAVDPWAYQQFIQRSMGEFTVAKEGYVASRSGWFSERSAAYLASGRPVVTQETGFSRWLPTGEGLFAFTTPDEAQEACEMLLSRPGSQRAAARALAEEHFDSRKVLARLLDDSFGIAPTPAISLVAPSEP